MLFRRLHLQLTGLCALITASILAVFTIAYLSVAEHTMLENLTLTFRNQYDTISSSLKQQPILSYPYLLRMEQNNDCLIFLWDNESPLSFNHLETHADYMTLADALYAGYCARAEAGTLQDAVLLTSSRDFLSGKTVVNDLPSNDIYMGISNLSTDGMSTAEIVSAIRKKQGLTLLVLSPNTGLHSRLTKQRVTFALLSIAGCVLLTLFSYFFTGRMLKPLRENQEKQLAFISGASHELRTPLAVILSAVSAKPPQFENAIKTEALRMGNLVDEMLLLSRLDEQANLNRRLKDSPGSPVFQLTSLEPDTFLLNFYEQMEGYVSSKDRNLSLTLPEEPVPNIKADGEKLYRLLEILVENAVSYTADGGHIRLSLCHIRPSGRKASCSQVCFQVSDDGIGIPDAEKEKIFERFYRAESSRSSKDHFGLGLCIAKEIVEAHGGSIVVTDTPGGGATFKILLHFLINI